MESDCLNGDRAIEKDEFLPHFQPLVDLRTGSLFGFELLARWNHPERGWIAPDIFIPLAERDGWIDRLTGQLLEKGFRAAALLPAGLSLSINISPVQLRNPELPDRIRKAAERAGFSIERLVVEITESALTESLESARRIAQELKAMGARLALDDFGTGYSSLSHLQSLPFDELKVDRSFVSSMTEKRESRKIVAAVVGLGQSLGMTTVAEGVESPEQAEMLRWLGCELGQGWLFGRPVPASELAGVVEAMNGRAPSNPSNSSGGIMGRVSLGSMESTPAQRLSQLQAVYDGAPVGLAFVDRELRYRNLNRRLAVMNGHPMADHLGRTVEEMIPETYPLVEPYLQRALAGEAIDGLEVTRPSESANAGRTLLLTYEPARDEAGEVVGVSVAIADITPIKHAEAARRESEAHFRYMIELLPQIPWIIDAEGRALDVSQRWRDLTGMTDDEWRGFGWLKALHPEDVTPTREAMDTAFRTLTPIDIVYRVRRSEKDPWQALRSRGAPRVGPDGKVVCWYGCLEAVDQGIPAGPGEGDSGETPKRTKKIAGMRQNPAGNGGVSRDSTAVAIDPPSRS